MPLSKSRPAAAAPSARISLSDVARAAGVALMTASYAMRNNPKISQPTRDRVHRAARKLGYVPHPEIGRLMHLLRTRRLPSFQATLAFLSLAPTVRSAAADHRYTLDVVTGARRRAVSLGYAVDVFNVRPRALSTRRLTTMLKSRGIRGILIPPLVTVEDCAALLDWSQFAIVAATYSAQNLIVNRVVPHHQANILAALAHLKQLRFRRVGLVLTSDLLLRANSAYQAVLALNQQLGEFAPIPALGVDAAEPERSAGLIHPWLESHRPDILVTVENAIPLLKKLLGARFASKTQVCLLDHSGVGPFAGIHQEPLIVGETAIDVLAGMLQRGEFGPQPHPRITMIEGTWVAGEVLRRPPK